MAIGKSKRKAKKGKKKGPDPFTRKEWYDLKAPNVFARREIGKTVCTKTIGKRLAKDNLMGRVVEVSLADLSGNPDDSYRKFKLKVDHVDGTNLLTNFYGMSLTTDKLRSLVKKWHTLIEAHADVKTTDGYLLRVFVIGLTKRVQHFQRSKTTYAQTSQVKKLRRKMVEVIQRNASVPLKEFMKNLAAETIGKEIEKKSLTVYPLQTVFVRKVKTLKAPKVDITKLQDLHTATAESLAAAAPVEAGAAVERFNEEQDQVEEGE